MPEADCEDAHSTPRPAPPKCAHVKPVSQLERLFPEIIRRPLTPTLFFLECARPGLTVVTVAVSLETQSLSPPTLFSAKTGRAVLEPAKFRPNFRTSSAISSEKLAEV